MNTPKPFSFKLVCKRKFWRKLFLFIKTMVKSKSIVILFGVSQSSIPPRKSSSYSTLESFYRNSQSRIPVWGVVTLRRKRGGSAPAIGEAVSLRLLQREELIKLHGIEKWIFGVGINNML